MTDSDHSVSHRRILEPFQLRHLTLRNRIVFGAHTANMAVDGLPGNQHLAYYRERAMGGAAMLVIEPMPVHPAAVLTRGNFRHSDDAVIPHFRRITDTVHAEGAVILQQLYHVGQHGDADNSYHPNFSPSGLPSYHDSDGSHAMTEQEIEQTIDGFVAAARRCHKAGFDGVEVWAAYHGMVDQFWTPWSNRRNDRFGGSLENRTRMSREILTRIRREAGDDFIIGLAVNDEPDVEVALSREALAEIIERHDRDHLIDYVTCGTGGYFDFYKLMPTFLYPEKLGVDLAGVLKGTVRHAAITAESHIRTPDNAESVLAQGQADLVSIVRGQIADPHLVNKVRRGVPEQIRGCLSCNQMCWGRRYRDYWISCLVNPSAGREFEFGGDRFKPATKARTVLVVGGGPAGLEAARVAAERGHRVRLVEASDRLGGQFLLAGLQPRRGQIIDLIDWYARELERLLVQINFNTYYDEDEVRQSAAEVVILATGSLPAGTGFQKAVPHVERLPGYDESSVFAVEDVMRRDAKIGQNVVVLDEGGNWRGAGTALKLAEDGHQVTVVTPDPLVGKELQRSAADFPLRQRLASLGVRFIVDAAITAWSSKGAEVISLLDRTTILVDAQTLVLATTNQAFDPLSEVLVDYPGEVRAIGDCVAPRQAAFVIYEGRVAGLEI
ncbi:MAG: hypothetical protein DHS20C01_07590 [marine bacterium B5-7]|nr:MAG: hypothetical protein DHS20C01_07590 [marine bacterium B5-7]